MSEKYYSPQDHAEIFQVSKDTIYRWINEQRMESIKIDHTIRVSQTSLDSFLQKRKLVSLSSLDTDFTAHTKTANREPALGISAVSRREF
jgi:excisionase family DNA binding protein